MPIFYLQIDPIFPIIFFMIPILLFSVLYLLFLQSLRTKRQIALNNLKGKIIYGKLKNQKCLNEVKYDTPSASKDLEKVIDNAVKDLLDKRAKDKAGDKHVRNKAGDTLKLMAKFIDSDLFQKIYGDNSSEKIGFVLNYSFYTMLKKRYLGDNDTDIKTVKIDKLRTKAIQLINQEIDLAEFKMNEIVGQMCK